MNSLLTKYIGLALAMTSLSAISAETKPAVDVNATIISVNKVPLTQGTYIDTLRANLASGAQDSQQFRQAVLDDLVISEALAQEAKKAKLDKDADIKRALDTAQRKLLAEAYMVKQLQANPVTEADAKAEYERQVGLTKDGRNSVEYKASQIVVKDEASAQEAIKRLKAGEDFAKVAKEMSIDPTAKQRAGSLPWSLPDQFIKPLGDIVTNLEKGQVVNAPIQSPLGWHIILLEDSRPFKAPSFEESKGRMMQTLLERKKQEIIESVMQKAEVK